MKIFILLSRFPYPLEKGDKLRAYNHIKYLSKNNEITLCAINTAFSGQSINFSVQYKALNPFCKTIEIINLSKFDVFKNLLRGLFSKKPFQVEYFYSKKAQKRIDGLIQRIQPDHILCQLIRVSEYVKDSDISKTLDYQDVFSKGIERRMTTSPFYQKWFLKIELNRLLKYENSIFGNFDNKVIISKPDRDFIPHEQKDKIIVVPNGVDTDYFSLKFKVQDSQLLQNSPIKRFDLLFTGNMGYYPNVISAIYLAKEILPKLLSYNSGLSLLIAGANPARNVKQLRTENIFISGWVEDMRDCYSESKIFIAPMLIGTGLQNKLLEAMAMRLPCITSKLANEALEAENGKSVIVCNTVEDYVEKILELLNNKAKYDEIARNGYNFVLKKYNWRELTEKFELIMKTRYESQK